MKWDSIALMALCILVIFFGLDVDSGCSSGIRQVGKESRYEKSAEMVIVVPEREIGLRRCIKDCMRRNQMQSVGIEVIETHCRHKCEFKQALILLNSNDPKKRIEGVEKLRGLKDKTAVPYLISALKREFGERTGLWAWIIPTLGELKDPAAVPVLVDALKNPDENWLGREKAAEALGEICDPRSVPALIEAAGHMGTRLAALSALGKIQDKRAIPVFLSVLYPEEEQNIRNAAMQGLKNLGRVAVPEIIKAFSSYSREHPDTRRRVWLCRLLAESRDKRAKETLRKAMYDPDEVVRRCATTHFHVH